MFENFSEEEYLTILDFLDLVAEDGIIDYVTHVKLEIWLKENA